jgi:hypothetical protein
LPVKVVAPVPGAQYPGSSRRPAQPAAVLHHLVRPRASLRAGLAEQQPRRVPCRRPRPVTHMMPGIRVVLVPVTSLPSAICPGELWTADRADLLGDLGESYGEHIVCHLRNPLRHRWLCAWPGGSGVVAAAPVARCSRNDQPTPRRVRCPCSRKTHPRTGEYWPVRNRPPACLAGSRRAGRDRGPWMRSCRRFRG